MRLRERSQGRCERCNTTPATLEASHRVAKGMGGTSSDQSSLALYAHLCHGCHAWVEANPKAALSAGWKVPPGTAPQDWPVHMFDGNYLLDAEGGMRPSHTVRDVSP
jgi:hypothetical protein